MIYHSILLNTYGSDRIGSDRYDKNTDNDTKQNYNMYDGNTKTILYSTAASTTTMAKAYGIAVETTTTTEK